MCYKHLKKCLHTSSKTMKNMFLSLLNQCIFQLSWLCNCLHSCFLLLSLTNIQRLFHSATILETSICPHLLTGNYCHWDFSFLQYCLFTFFFLNKFIYFILFLFLAVLGLRCCTWAFSSCSEQGLLFVAVRGLPIAVASLVAEHRL